MKKLLSMILALLMIVTLTACGGESTEAQEKVVKSYFTCIKNADMDKIKTICTSKYQDKENFESVDQSFSTLLNEDTFGETFVKEAKVFKSELFKAIIKNYKIESTEETDDGYDIKVTGKKIAAITDIFDETEATKQAKTLATDYQELHLSELKEIYQSQGMTAMQKALYGGIAKDYFSFFTDKLKDAKYEDFTATFKLVESGDEWKINSATI